MKHFAFRMAGQILFLAACFAFITLNFAFLASLDDGLQVMRNWAGVANFCWPFGLATGLPLLVALVREKSPELFIPAPLAAAPPAVFYRAVRG